MANLSRPEADRIQRQLDDLNAALLALNKTSALTGQSAQDLADHFGSAAEATKAINREMAGLQEATQGVDNVFMHIVEQMKQAETGGKNYRVIQQQINDLSDRLLRAKREEGNLSREELTSLKKKILLRLQEKNLSDDLTKALKEQLGLVNEQLVVSAKANAAKGIKDYIGQVFSLGKMFGALKEAIFSLDTSATNMAKGMNITYDNAIDIQNSFNTIAMRTGDVAVRSSTLAKTQVEINQSLGISAILREKELVFMTKLREKAGFTAEELNKIYLITKATGQDQEKFTASFLASARIASNRAGIALNEKKLLQDTLNISKAMQLSFGGNAEALAKAAVEAKKVGISMEKLESIASSLLDFESSIAAELEAEVLTGRNLNLELARVYAINNDIEGLSREIGKNYGTVDDFLKSNRLQQEAMAKAVGMTREELAGSLLEAKAIGNATGEEADRRRKAFEFAKEKYGQEEAAKMLAEGQLETLEHQMGTQEKFLAAVEKIKEAFANIGAGPLLKIVNGLASLADSGWKFKTAMTLASAVMGALAARSIVTALALSGGTAAFGIALGAAALGLGGAFLAFSGGDAPPPQIEPTSPAGDIYVPPTMGNNTPIVDLGVGKKFKVNPRDAIKAGPVDNTQSSDSATTHNLLREMLTTSKEYITAIREKQFMIDSQQFRSTAATSNYKVGAAYS